MSAHTFWHVRSRSLSSIERGIEVARESFQTLSVDSSIKSGQNRGRWIWAHKRLHATVK